MPLPLSENTLSELLALLAEEEEYVFLETSRINEEEHRSLLFRAPRSWLCCGDDDDPDSFFGQAEKFLAKGLFLAGWFSYEFGYLLEPGLRRLRPRKSGLPLACLGVFAPPHIHDHQTGAWSGAGPWPCPARPGKHSDHAILNLRENITESDYFSAIDRIKQYIEAGDTYQVNYTFKLLFELAGEPEALYAALRRNQSVSFGALLRRGEQRIMSFSPELFFKKRELRCLVRPMKGTMKRGRHPAEDLALADFLRHDTKNRSENVMIVDLLRNDLGRICAPGSVRVTSLFDVEPYETLHQMTSTIEGRLPPASSLAALFKALFPCGSVTGAPKIRTMEIIRELEPEPRGVYTGAIGFIAPSGETAFNVPIRTLLLNGHRGEMGVGSGVVYDSDPGQEWQECLLKGSFLSAPTPPFQLIETILWLPTAGFWLLAEHLERLQESARHLLFPCDPAAVLARLEEAASRFAKTPMRVRLTLAKDGELHLAASECAAPGQFRLGAPRLPRGELPRVRFSGRQTDPASPFLYHKTTLRELYDRERQLATEQGYYEVLFTNTRGEVTEGSISNLFVETNGRLLTPPIDSGLLNGVLRRHLFKHPPLPIEERTLTREDLRGAEAVYVGNSVRGLVRVDVRAEG